MILKIDDMIPKKDTLTKDEMGHIMLVFGVIVR